tara:strand:+ start:7682 stop:8323 length:642 start_codon:yes stop_codon:yes gene_type:complete
MAELAPTIDFDSILDGLDGFSHIWLLWAFHEHEASRNKNKVSVPKLNGQKRGCFATRSPIRPNPIALSCVELLRVEGRSLHFRGVDFLDHSPLFDIKPYIPEYDKIMNAKSASWRQEQNPMQVIFEDMLQTKLLSMEKEIQKDYPDFQDIRTCLTEILQEDPRPYLYQSRDKVYHMQFYQYDVQFFIDNNRLVVKGIVDLKKSAASSVAHSGI